MRGFETVFSHRQFEVLKAGKNRYYLKLKGGLRYASPGLKRITREEARKVVQEHAARELKQGLQELVESMDRLTERMKAGLKAREEPKVKVGYVLPEHFEDTGPHWKDWESFPFSTSERRYL